MSSRTDNRHRVATICRRATGLPLHVCHRWAAEGIITRAQPVPDAVDASQRAFEAQIVLVLADRLRHEQVDGALFGFTRAEPTGAGLILHLHPVTADRVVAELLPRIDTRYGGMRGVAGLRLTGEPGRWQLSGLADGTEVRLRHPHPAWTPFLPEDEADTTYLWRRNPRRLHGIETNRPLDGWGEARDWLLSRLLRRNSLVNEAGAAHGWANTYTHGSRGVVIEWCCAVSADHLARGLVRSGLTAVPASLAGTEEPDHAELARYGQLHLGDAVVTVRQGGCAEQRPVLKGRVR
ncbi:hypothetical protein [Streptomyces sp. NBC_01244]|uniref:hypothetical protein n=1 Tax=Streptomyces sp. NBC_01244 TaxID=2903797 RepID=UPI002E10A5C7|nr:hypothetical protein OG247_29845 [Streptomyces sp. NBC_01244]